MFRAGDKVLLRKEARGPLDCKYEGPYTILRRVGEDAMISLPGADKWVHLNRCKPYEKSQLVSPTWGRPMEDIRREEEGTERNEENAAREREDDSSTSELTLGTEANPQDEAIYGDVVQPEPRYPRRTRQPPKWLRDFVCEEDITATLSNKKS